MYITFISLLICAKLQKNQIVVRADSKTLIELVTNKAKVPWQLRPLFRKISRYKYLVKEFQHCYRESNMIADILAKEAQVHKSSKIFQNLDRVSSQVIGLYHLDNSSICNFRFTKKLVF